MCKTCALVFWTVVHRSSGLVNTVCHRRKDWAAARIPGFVSSQLGATLVIMRYYDYALLCKVGGCSAVCSWMSSDQGDQALSTAAPNLWKRPSLQYVIALPAGFIYFFMDFVS